MKRNETILVYSVTGLLVVILGVAIAFGDGGVQAGSSLDLKSLDQLQGIVGAKPVGTPTGDPAGNPGDAPTGVGALAKAADGAGDVQGPPVVSPGPDVPLNAPGVPALSDAATRAIVLLGESSRDGDYRVVSVRHGDTFSQLVQRWCGGIESMDLAASLNEEFDLQRLEPGTRLYLPWVDDEVLLTALEKRKAAPASAPPGSGRAATNVTGTGAGGVEDYKVKPGDMLWNIAVSRVGANKANRFIEAVRDLNPDLRADPNRLVVGKTIVLPR